MLSIFAQLYLQDHVSNSRQFCIWCGYCLDKKRGDVVSLYLSFLSLPVSSCFSLFPAAHHQLIRCVVFCFALVVPHFMSAQLFVFRLAKHPQLVASGCESQIPSAFVSTSGGKPPGKEEMLSIFFWATGITTCPQNCPVSLGCSGFHADGLDKVTNICSKHPRCTGRSMI